MDLTSAKISSLPKLDKDHFVSTYIQAQRLHAKAYAEEGRVLSSAWNSQHLTPEKPPAVACSRNIGFSTPVLIAARTARPTEPEKSSKQENAISADKKIPDDPLPVPKSQKPKSKAKAKSGGATENEKSLSKKRGVDLDAEEDQAARLTERRERKRIKRAIVQGSEHDTALSDGAHEAKNRPKAKGNKAKTPSGYALMHGFAATNLGKNRLTLKPPSNVGVFKKGKASANTKTRHKPKAKRRQTHHFSELGFLNPTKETTKKIPKQSHAKSSASDNESSSTATDDAPEPDQTRHKKPGRTKAKSCQTLLTDSPQQSSQLVKGTAPPRRVLVESEIWDIESRPSAKEKPLSVQEASCVQETVILDARKPTWCDRIDQDYSRFEMAQDPDAVDASPIPSTLSLRPSQSASQIGQVIVIPDHAKSVSRYFANKNQTPRPKPQTAPVTSASPFDSPPRSVQHSNNTRTPNVFPVPSQSNPIISPKTIVKTRFLIPPRIRVFAEQFPLIPDLQTQAFDLPQPYAPLMVEGDDYPQSDYCDWHPDIATDYGTFSEIRETEYVPNEDVFYPSFDCGLDHTATHGAEDLGDDWSDGYGDEVVAGPETWRADLGYDKKLDGSVTYSEDNWGLDVEVESVPFPDQCDDCAVKGPMDDFDYNGNALEEDFGLWEEANEDTQYLTGQFDGASQFDEETWRDTNAMVEIESAQDFGPVSPRMSPLSGILCSEESDCSDKGSNNAPCFSQGRALLLGLPIPHYFETGRTSHSYPQLSDAEVDVGKALRDHWLPQRL